VFMCLSVENVIPICTTQNHTHFVLIIFIFRYFIIPPKLYTMLSLTASRALQSTRLLVDMSTPSWMKGTSSFVSVAVGVFMFSYAMLYLYCLVTLIISTFTEISEEFKMIHRHRLSDITPTTSPKKDATTTTDADDEDTSDDNTTTVNATVEQFFDAKYSHQMWMNELLLIYFKYSILLHQRFIQFYQAEFIEETLGYVSTIMTHQPLVCHNSLIFFSSSSPPLHNYTGI